MRNILTAITTLASLSGLAAANEFKVIAQSAGPTSVFDLSANGSVAVGVSDGAVFRWATSDGTSLISPQSYFHTFTAAVSADGNTIVSAVADDTGLFSAARWQNWSWTNLGGLPGQTAPDGEELSTGWGVSGDGSTVVGLGWHTNYRAEAFKWTSADGMVGLGKPANSSSRATSISADGSTTVGFYEHPDFGMRRAARWVNGAPVDLFLGHEDDWAGEAQSVTSDGKWIVGGATITGGNQRAFLYSDDTGPINLGAIGPDDFGLIESYATDISDTGIVVGWSGDRFFDSIRPIVWTEATGMIFLADYLAAAGVIVPDNQLIISVTTISADGLTIGGQAYDTVANAYTGWIATVPAPSGSLLALLIAPAILRRRR
ncbi:MAG: hypothetical protein IT435_13390 [Phycisphaerales bacterium]|nr:hypothetical protein [Phycisphaerales bacterium]